MGRGCLRDHWMGGEARRSILKTSFFFCFSVGEFLDFGKIPFSDVEFTCRNYSYVGTGIKMDSCCSG